MTVSRNKDVQDGSSSNEEVIAEPATLDPEAKKLLDKPMSPNQPPPIKSDKAAGRAGELDRIRAQQEAVADANRDVLPKLGGNTWANEREAAEAESKGGKS